MSLRLPLLASFLVGACAPAASAEPWLTIIDAPPAPFVAVSAEPAPKTPEQVAAESRFWAYAKWQAGVRDQAVALHQRLRKAEPGNYVDMRFESDSDPFTVVYAFLRKGPETLRRHARRADFVAETVRWSLAEQAAAGEKTVAFFNRHEVRVDGGWGNKQNRPIFKVGITRAEYEALAKRHGFTLPEPVLLTFVERSGRDLNQPLPADVAKGIRLFARSFQPIGPVPDTMSMATVVLRDGCFRLKEGTQAHVVFPLGYTLHRDSEGFPTFGSARDRGNARVGEEARFHGLPAEVTDARLLAEVRSACGEGPVVAVSALRSVAFARQQERLDQRRWLRSHLKESYGLSQRGIEAFIADCESKMGGACRETPPPPAQGPCPAGTKLSFGLCRTPQGHIRPLPAYLEPYAKL